jgi:hypothetical protein
LYHRSWADALLARTFDMLRQDYERAGKISLYDALKHHLSGARDEASYKALGGPLGLSVGAVATSVYRMRKRCAELLRQEISQTVGSPGEIDDEIAFLFSALET